MPVVLSIAAAGIALVFILTELKDRRDKKRGVASTMQAIKSVTNQQSIEGVPYPIVLSSNTTGSAFKTYRNQGGRLIVRLMAAKPVQNTT